MRKLHESGHAHPVSCVDCHDPGTMKLRVTRPGFINGIQALAASDAAVPHLPSIEQWRAGARARPYDPNVDAHAHGDALATSAGNATSSTTVRPRCRSPSPGDKGLRAEDTEKFWNETKFPDGEQFFDYKHAETRREDPEGPASGIRAVEPGHSRAQRRRLRRLPHAVHARRRDQGLGPLGAQPAAERQPRVPDVPSLLRRGNQVTRGRDPDPELRVAAAWRYCDRGPARRRRRPQSRLVRPRRSCRTRSSCSARRNGGSTSSPRRTRWVSTRRRKRRWCWAKRSTTHARVNWPRAGGASRRRRRSRQNSRRSLLVAFVPAAITGRAAPESSNARRGLRGPDPPNRSSRDPRHGPAAPASATTRRRGACRR